MVKTLEQTFKDESKRLKIPTIHVLFTETGFVIRFYREQPENRYYTFRMNDEQREIIYQNLFKKFTNKD